MPHLRRIGLLLLTLLVTGAASPAQAQAHPHQPSVQAQPSDPASLPDWAAPQPRDRATDLTPPDLAPDPAPYGPPCPSGQCGGDDPAAPVPVDGGLIWLALAGGAYALQRLRAASA